MSNVDFGQYKRIVQAFWDPEPKNDDPSDSPIWCLGQEYSPKGLQSGVSPGATDDREQRHALANGDGNVQGKEETLTPNGLEKEKEKGASSQTGKADSSWPSDFLDDCEARTWFTYRSSFPPIQKSPEASMTLSVRLRSLGEQAGFTSDTGWGCMIRSGQSLLANALMTLRLGRSEFVP